MSQSIKPLSLDFCSGHDLTVRGFKPRVRLHTVSLGFSLSPSLSALLPLARTHTLSLSKYINKLKTRKSRGFRWTETQEEALTYFRSAVRTFNTLVPACEDSKYK